MSVKLVTLPQVQSLRQMANDKGVSREVFQAALDDGNFVRFLDGLKAGAGGIVPPMAVNATHPDLASQARHKMGAPSHEIASRFVVDAFQPCL